MHTLLSILNECFYSTHQSVLLDKSVKKVIGCEMKSMISILDYIKASLGTGDNLVLRVYLSLLCDVQSASVD